MRLNLLAAVIVASVTTAVADVRLPGIFTDNMVLQRDLAVRVWGWAEAGEAVSAQLDGNRAATQANENGEWALELPAIKAGENLELTVTGSNHLTVKNILVGDIWVCSGDSNMELAVDRCLGAADDIRAADLPKIRRINFNKVKSSHRESDVSVATPWEACSPGTAARFSAAGFYFAREIHRKTGVPIGLIEATWAGSRIEPWVTREGLRRRPTSAVPPYPPIPPDVSIFSAMIYPIVRFPIKGVLWYQGEANLRWGSRYLDKMCDLISGWRKQWGQGDFSFYFAQLGASQAVAETPAIGDDWPRLRDAQTSMLRTSNTGMAVTIDLVPLGQSENPTPVNQYDVGLRLSLWALAHDYGQKNLEVSGPLFSGIQIHADRKFRLNFTHAGTGLMVGRKSGRSPAVEAKDENLRGFEIAGADKRWFPAEAVIIGNGVIVSSPEVKEPEGIRYAYERSPAGANLYNREGLPAAPFCWRIW